MTNSYKCFGFPLCVNQNNVPWCFFALYFAKTPNLWNWVKIEPLKLTYTVFLLPILHGPNEYLQTLCSLQQRTVGTFLLCRGQESSKACNQPFSALSFSSSHHTPRVTPPPGGGMAHCTFMTCRSPEHVTGIKSCTCSSMLDNSWQETSAIFFKFGFLSEANGRRVIPISEKKRWKRLKNSSAITRMQSTETTFAGYEWHEIGFSSDLLLWLPSCSSKRHGGPSRKQRRTNENTWDPLEYYQRTVVWFLRPDTLATLPFVSAFWQTELQEKPSALRNAGIARKFHQEDDGSNYLHWSQLSGTQLKAFVGGVCFSNQQIFLRVVFSFFRWSRHLVTKGICSIALKFG